jgi:hypothetical protein
MAYPVQTITTTKVATGPIVLRYGAAGGTTVSRVTEVTDIDTGKTLYEHKGYNATGDKQNVSLFPIELGSGKVSVTVDELSVANMALSGEYTYVSISQAYMKSAASPNRSWEWYAAKAYVNMKGIKPSQDSPSTVTFDIIPYNDPGTAPWAFSADAACPPANH